jgi:hypothetical protein
MRNAANKQSMFAKCGDTDTKELLRCVLLKLDVLAHIVDSLAYGSQPMFGNDDLHGTYPYAGFPQDLHTSEQIDPSVPTAVQSQVMMRDPFPEGRKADRSEVAHESASCILQRPLDVVPRGVSTGPSGLNQESQQIVGIWEPLDPWLFLDREELRCVRESCPNSAIAVDKFTPFFCFCQDRMSGVKEDSVPDQGHDGEDDLDCDEMEELCQLAIRQDPENQERRFQQLLEERKLLVSVRDV